MGEKSRGKWQRRIEKALAQNSAALQESTTANFKPLTVLVWLRSCGAGALLAGSLGLMSTFFWPSVCAVYLGLSLFVVDVLVERFNSFFKSIVIGAILYVAYQITTVVIFHKGPIVVQFRGYSNISSDRQGILEVSVLNPTDTDYHDLDFRISLPEKDYIINARQDSVLATCTVFRMEDIVAHQG